MALFTKKLKEEEKSNNVLIPEEIIDFNKQNLLGSFLLAVLEIGDESDYEYICKATAKMFFNQNRKFLNNIVKNHDDLHVNFEFLNYFFETFKLGTFQASIDENTKEIRIYHYNSPFSSIHKNEFFLKEFYKMFFELLLDTTLEINERNEDEKIIFIITV